MPLSKFLFKPGVNKENTRYTTEGGWYDCDKIRFRQGNPEKIGGWTQFAAGVFLGTCRSLWNWITLAALNLVGVGTNLKFYIMSGGLYYDITPIRKTITLSNPFTATDGSAVISVVDTNHGCVAGDFVTYSGAGIVGLGGNITAAVLANNFQITFINDNEYTITASVTANAADATGGWGGGYWGGGTWGFSSNAGGGTVVTQYETNTGPSYQIPLIGWGGGTWGGGTWGVGSSTDTSLQLWNQQNFGEDLIYGPRGQGAFYWSANIGFSPIQITISIAAPGVITLPSGFSFPDSTTITLTSTGALPTGLTVGQVYFVVNSTGGTFNVATSINGAAITTTGSQSGTQRISQRGIDLADAGDNDAPLFQNFLIVSDVSRFVLVFGTNDYGSTAINPMLIRWSDQEDPFTWSPQATNQAGSLPLSHGSSIITAIQSRQEIVVFTDSSIYSLQYVGPPFVWTAQLIADNVSIVGPNAAVIASGAIYWMGIDKFYKYDGRVQTLNCDLRRHIFNDFNILQTQQVFAGTNEGFNEVWWFYCSANAIESDRYVIYNYVEDVWSYGDLGRSAWLDSGLLPRPIAATYDSELVQHEDGVDSYVLGTQTALVANISSSEFDIGDGHNFGYVWRIIPDLTFEGSSSSPTPTVTMTLFPMQSSGSGTGNTAAANVTKGSNYVITEEYTGIVYTRARGRQMIFKISSDQIGTTWQLGAPRLDVRPDGRR